jgi:hypothetical protein
MMWLITLLSLLATIANIYKKRWCFLIWSFTNAAWALYDIYLEAWPQAALMGTYFLLALWGLRKWRKEDGKNEG